MKRLALLATAAFAAACTSPAEVFDPVEITSEELDPGVPGSPYTAALTATGGDGSYAWQVASGSLPAGLTLDPSGRLGGTPTASGTAYFAVAVTTGDQQTAIQPLHLEVSAGPSLLSPELGAILDNGCSFATDNPIRWDFDWADVEGAAVYQIVVRGASAIYDLVDTATEESDYRFDGVGGYIINENRLGWTWKVRASVNGSWGAWSVQRLFHVEPNNTDCP